jgi:anthranilate phosphoribosyltransferase
MTEDAVRKDLLERVRSPTGLTVEEAAELAEELCENRYTIDEAGALLSAMAERGETAEELLGFARTLRKLAIPFDVPGARDGVDLCGTGGAPFPTFNVSTVAAFVVSACGQPVVKHGNSSHRGPCGSSDLLEALGLPVKTSLEFPQATFEKESLAFLHAPLFHRATRNVAPVRQRLGTRTIFNLLGPLTNPAHPRYQLVGAYSTGYAQLAVEVLPRLSCERVLAVHGDEGCDELSPGGPSSVFRWDDHGLSIERVEPEDLLSPGERDGDWTPLPPTEAARETEMILQGSRENARAGAVVLAAGAALWVTGRTEDLEGGVTRAREGIRSGRALSKLESLRALVREGGKG